MILYIDPGTGSMLFTILLGALGTLFYFFRSFVMKLRFILSGGKAHIESSEKTDIVIFSDHKRYWNIFEPICDELERRDQKAIFMTASEDDLALSKDYKNVECKYIGTGNRAFSKLNTLEARIVLSTTPSLDVFQWKRSKKVDYYVHIAHAADDITKYRMFGIDFYDAILLSGKFQGEQIRKLEEIRGISEKEIEYVGLPFMDEMKKKLDGMPPRDKKTTEKTVLLAPSWGESGLLSKYGDKLIDALIDTGYNIIVRPHPQSYTSEKDMIDRLKKKYPNSDKFSWNNDNDNFEVLYESDILISDFSGIFFDYTLVFDKPVIYTSYDFDGSPYDLWCLDEELWTFKALRRMGKELRIEDIDSIKNIIDECTDSQEFADGRQLSREETWMYPGEGAKRVVDYLIRKNVELESKAEKDEGNK